MQPRVFIPQETQRRDKNTGAWRPVVNLKPALEFGNLIHMTDGKSGTLDVPQMVKDMTSALMGFHEGWDGRPGNPDAVAFNANELKSVALYNLSGAFLWDYANLSNEMADAKSSVAVLKEFIAEVDYYEKVREEVKLASGDYIDMKMYEPAMRHLLDTYIRAEESEKLSAFDDMTLVELIVERGEEAVESLPKGIRENPKAIAETIENNVRKLIIDEMAVNPKYYEKMSELLDALIQTRKKEAMDYKAYLAKIVELTKKVSKPETQSSYPASINSPARRALFDNLEQKEELAVQVDTAIQNVKKAGWRGNRFKEREVRIAIKSVLGNDDGLVDAIFEIVKNQRGY